MEKTKCVPENGVVAAFYYLFFILSFFSVGGRYLFHHGIVSSVQWEKFTPGLRLSHRKTRVTHWAAHARMNAQT